jgi:hypothetical protein
MSHTTAYTQVATRIPGLAHEQHPCPKVEGMPTLQHGLRIIQGCSACVTEAALGEISGMGVINTIVGIQI